MAARLGVEPRQNESESFVLPLHHQAVGIFGNWSRRWDSNPQPPVYKTGALPLSYAGPGTEGFRAWTEKKRRESNGGSPGTRTPNLLIKSQLLYH